MLDSDDVRRMVAAKLESKTQRELAEELGVSCSYLNDYLHFRREPGPTMLEALGLRRVAMYERTARPALTGANARTPQGVRLNRQLCSTAAEGTQHEDGKGQRGRP